jgi:hypothetical protein
MARLNTKKETNPWDYSQKTKAAVIRTPIPQDLHLAVCCATWDIGTQFSERYGKSIHKVIIVWEIPGCRAEFEKEGVKRNVPRTISKRYTLSLHKKADLRKDLEAWRGRKFTEEELKGFDIKKLLGAPCQIQVLHNKVDDKIYANIAAITKAPAGTNIRPETPLKSFSFEEGGTIPDGTPDWIRTLIRQSEESMREMGYSEDQHHDGDEETEEVPF